MKKKFWTIGITMVVLAGLIGCGAKEVMSTNVETVEKDTAVVENTVENIEETIASENEAETNVVEVPVTEKEYQYEEQRDIFVVENIDIGDGTKLDLTNREIDERKYTLTESIDIY